jgi:hypothetical protein
MVASVIMAKPLTADDVLPIVASLTPQERVRLLRLISPRSAEGTVTAYRAAPVGQDEFSADGDPLSWDSGGWENVG